MATAASPPWIERARTAPLGGPALFGLGALVWIAGALYCSGYEALSSGLDNWPGSLLWSAAAVLPWLALFEWSKSPVGRRLAETAPRLALALAATAILSLVFEGTLDTALGNNMAPLGLSLLRRLPAIGVCLAMIAWSRAGPANRAAVTDESLSALAPSIDWVEAADNYVELHVRGRALLRRMTMRDAEAALAGRGFVRIHRRYLVNGARIAGVTGTGDQVRLTTGALLPVGRAFAPNLRAAA